jgi:polar amino acid transport system substrate-binding protein
MASGFARMAGVASIAAGLITFGTAALGQPASLRVGLTTTAPFGGATPGGYCFDLMNAIAERTGLQFEFVQPMAAGELIPALVGGTFDILCSANGATNERRAMGLAFTSAIATNGEMLVVPTADTTPYAALAELRSLPVGAPAGTLFVGMLRSAGVAEVTEYAGPALYQALIAGEVKAVLTSAPTFAYQQRALGLWPELRIVDTYAIANPIYSAIAVRNTEIALLGTIQAALEALKADGTVAGLLEIWAIPAPPF